MFGRYALSGMVLLLATGQAAAAEVLQHNPFKQPVLEDTAQAGVTGDAPTGDLTLRATLAAGDGSIANINGQLFHLGDEVSGYQLREINEGSVGLFRNEQVRRLTVRDDTEE
jgi:hypothetical protein